MSLEPPAGSGQALLALVVAVLAAGTLIGLFLSEKREAALIAGSLVMIAAFLASGNHRLFCLYATVALAPFTLAKHFVLIPHMGGAGSFSIDAIDPFLLMLVIFELRDIARGRRHHLRFTPLFVWWSGMMLLGTLDAAFGPLRMMAAEEVVRMAKCYLLFFVIVNEVVRLRQFTHLLIALIAGMALEACAGIIQSAFKISLGLQFLGEASQETIRITSVATFADGGDAGFRINGLLGHPNLLAAYLSMLLPVCIALLFSRIPTRVKLPLGAATAAGLLALIMTLSRTGWLTFGCAFVLLYALSFLHPRLRRRYLFARVAAVACAVLVVLPFTGTIAKRFFESDPGAVNFRYEWMDAAWEMVQEKPLLGHGLNTFIYHLPGRTRYGGELGLNDSLGKDWPAVHDVYLLTWSEQGTLGFVCFMAMNIWLLWVGIRNLRRYYSDVLYAVNLGSLCGIVTILIDGLSSIYTRSPAPARIFWIVAAMMVAVDYWNTVNAPGRVIAQQPGGGALVPAPVAPAPIGSASVAT